MVAPSVAAVESRKGARRASLLLLLLLLLLPPPVLLVRKLAMGWFVAEARRDVRKEERLGGGRLGVLTMD